MAQSTLLVAYLSENRLMANRDAELYGIELEAEEYSRDHWREDTLKLSGRWRLEEDGSLRDGGVEFISRPLAPEEIEEAVRHLYARTREKWSPSVRTGIHLHANMLGRTMEEMRRIFAYYAFAEPLLFEVVGKVREENIYCVPWYRAPEEAHNAKISALNDWRSINSACKYSALFIGPLRSYGSIEFRHSPTWDEPGQLIAWVHLCQCVALSHTLPDPIALWAESGTEGVLRAVFGSLLHMMGLSMEQAVSMVESVGAHEIALIFQPDARIEAAWGKPGTFETTGTVPQRSTWRRSLFDLQHVIEAAQEEPRVSGEEDQDSDPDEEDYPEEVE